MVLSDRSIKEAIAQGRIIIDPLGEGCIQPSSVDLHIDQYFRVFRNHTHNGSSTCATPKRTSPS